MPTTSQKTILTTLTLLGTVTLGASQASASCYSDGYVGSMCWTIASYCPPGFLQANGETFSSDTYPDLRLSISKYFGSESGSPLLPNLNGRSVAGLKAGQGGLPGASLELGALYGNENISLSSENVPHTHTFTVNGSGWATFVGTTEIGSQLTMQDAIPASRPASGPPMKRVYLYTKYASSQADTFAKNALTVSVNNLPTETEVSGATGGGPGSLPLRPPQIALTACIRATGQTGDPIRPPKD